MNLKLYYTCFILFILNLCISAQPGLFSNQAYSPPSNHNNNNYNVFTDIYNSFKNSFRDRNLDPVINLPLKGPIQNLVITEKQRVYRRGKHFDKEAFIEAQIFNENGKLTTYIESDDDNDTNEIIKNFYNSKNRLIKRMRYGESFNDLEEVRIYKYKNADSLSLIKVYDAYGVLEKTYKYNYYKNRLEISNKDNVEKIYFNELDQKVKYEKWDNELDEYTEYVYDSINNLSEIKSVELTEGNVKYEFITKKQFNNDRIINESIYDSPYSKLINISYFYSGNKLIRKEHTVLTKNYTTKYHFLNFDKHGNFTKLKIEAPGKITFRDFNYTYNE